MIKGENYFRYSLEKMTKTQLRTLITRPVHTGRGTICLSQMIDFYAGHL